MLRKLYLIGMISLVVASTGCSVCCSPDDWNYGAYGGRWQRHDLSSGRVGSAFAEAGYDTMIEVSEAEPTPAGEPRELPGDDRIRPVNYETGSYETGSYETGSYETGNIESTDYDGVGIYIK